MIPLTRPWIEDAELDAVADVLRSGMLVQGKEVEHFERGVAARCGAKHGIAVSSGTAALVLGLQAMGIEPGDEVIVPALTWPSPAHAAQTLGATVKLVDVDPGQWNVTADAIRAAISPRTKAVIVIDQLGNPVDEALGDLGVPVLEDAACALGSTFASGAPCGSLGAIGCLSFHPRKVLTTGEGGVLVTSDDQVAEQLRALRNHGQAGPGRFVAAATNHRLTEMQGALGRVQLERLDEILRLRREHAEVMIAELGAIVTFQQAPEGAQPSYQTLGALLPAGVDGDAFITECRARGVQAGRLSYAVHRIGTIPHEGALPVSEDIVERGVALPLFPQMGAEARDKVISVVREVLGAS